MYCGNSSTVELDSDISSRFRIIFFFYDPENKRIYSMCLLNSLTSPAGSIESIDSYYNDVDI
ncbi:hypothetical protein HZS_7607 [Henneguya salminicola]|nr:hypothetical protein HZS_7607 [Henneguya salminicola]